MNQSNIDCMMTGIPVELTADATPLDAGDDRILIVHRGVVIGAVHTSAIPGARTLRLTITRDNPEQPFRGDQGQAIAWFKE